MSHYFEIRITPKQLLKKYSGLENSPILEISKLHYKVKSLFKKVAAKYACEQYVCCYEKLSTRDGSDLSKVDKEHFHFRFCTLENTKKDTLQSWVKRNADFKLSGMGNECYAILAFTVQSDDDWWQYPFKENYLPSLTKGFSPKEITKFKIASAAIHKRAIATSIKRALLKARKKTLFDRIYNYLETLPEGEVVATHKSIFIKILQYYLKENIELNPQSICAKTDRYRLLKGFISQDNYYTRLTGYIIPDLDDYETLANEIYDSGPQL